MDNSAATSASFRRRLKSRKPACCRCVKSGLTCPGYNRPVKWSTKYEIDYGPLSYADSSSRDVPGMGDPQVGSEPPCHISNALMLYTPHEESSKLLSHYFSSACEVLSCFDSVNNPYRSDLSDMIQNSPVIFNCVLSASAAHLCQQDKEASSTPLTFQTEAISCISRDLVTIDFALSQNNRRAGFIHPSTVPTIKDELILGIILVGMTSSWHDPSSLGLCHFYGARQVFKAWMAKVDTNNMQSPSYRIQRLVVSSMVYWEVMASCLIEQEIEAISYLDIFATPPRVSYPCPWTGVGTGIHIHLAKCIALVRKSRSVKLHKAWGEDISLPSLYFDMLNEAFALARDVDQSPIPMATEIQDTGDPKTPAIHLCKIAECHRLVARLELDRAFPELTYNYDTSCQLSQDDYDQNETHSQHVLKLAIKVLGIMETVPEESRTIAIQTIIWLTAGSALGYHSKLDASGRILVTNRRKFVLDRLYVSFRYLKLQTIKRVATILQEVWSRMDSVGVMGQDAQTWYKSPFMRVHWIDVMIEAHLETILG
ncbi:hypothetical protein F53441_2354 [Fusarium austroafricanum]|uniref:Zn(2)-C6 fungal-type domain-containing protein n=1 Tax=Fusarium austroafricanum TaxID=2364996 RepID=A0A8H4NXX5_9HYPO|nr:hypothetical protein F53441_2354 [Fusarium austroafricanum]